MKNINTLFLLLATLLIVSCGPDVDDDLLPTVDVEVNLKGAYDGELLLMRKDYLFDADTKIKFNRVSFYISDVVLLKDIDGGADEETGVIDLDLVDFTGFTELEPAGAAEGLSFVGTNIPVDQYKGLKMGIGVPPDLNKLSPDDQTLGPGHPLTNSVHYWQGWQSYMFAMIEGSVDLNKDGIYQTEESFKYHTGKDEAFQSTFLLQNINLVEGQNPKLEVTFDLKKLFFNNDGSPAVDPFEKLQTHNPDDFPFIQEFMIYFSRIFSL